MTKFEIIKSLADDGIFEITKEILDTIQSDGNPSHSAGNEQIRFLINSIHQMSDWLLFDWQNMLDLSAQAYGFEKFAAYSNVDICADLEDLLEDLHSILWTKYAHIPED